ncbi:MAG: polysaccharide biosynthesis/export family protein [Planctomycetota bacterium]
MARAKTLTTLSLFLALAANLSGCAFSRAGKPIPEIAQEINQTISESTAGLTEGDFLDVQFPNTPQWSHQVRVGLNGKASFLGIPEEVEVKGMTSEELRALLESKYQEFLTKPRVGLFVKEFAARPISVIGDVGRPGLVALESNTMPLLEALARAGGHRKDTSDLKRIILVRWDAENSRQLRWTIDASLEYWGIDDPVLLQPHDLVFVPNRGIDEVDIWVNNWIRRLLPISPSSLPGI